MAGPPSSDDPFGLCGHTIDGKYRVASVVGDGGFGVVYRAVHKGFGELIAVKCLKMPASLDVAQRDALLETLRDEGRLLHRLSRATSGIVQALDVGAFTTDAGVWVPYLVLEWLEGETLAQFLRGRSDRGEGGMPVAEAARLLGPAARALAIAHAQRVAHRDVKPANLFLTEVAGQRTLKVLDFGIAKVLTEYPTFTEALAATQQGPSAFTPRYGAPEQFNKARGATGPWTDVFALALIFVELVSGRKALDGDDPTQLYIASADPTIRPTLRARGADGGEAVERVLDKALAIEPKHRYPSAAEFWDALEVAVGVAAGAPTPSDPNAGSTRRAASHAEVDDRDGALDTAAFASKQGIDVVSERAVDTSSPAEPAPAPESAPVVVHDPTMPVESLVAAPRRPVSVKISEAAPPGVQRASSTVGPSRDDSMAETPPPHRGAASGPPPRRPSSASPTPPAQPFAAVAGGRSGGARSALGGFLLALVAGCGVLAYIWWSSGGGTSGAGLPGASSGVSAVGARSGAGGRGQPPAAGSGEAMADGGAAEEAGVAEEAGGPAASTEVPGPAVPPTPPADMVYFPPVTATIGAGQDQREVTLTRGFFLDRNEVTVRAYQACMATRVCSGADHVALVPEGAPPGSAAAVKDDTWSARCNEPRNAATHPINCVDFANADSYCRFRSRRLPTEAEWEVAARGVAARPYPWGAEEPTCERACYDRNGGCLVRGKDVATCPSGAHARDQTPEGVYDLAGNVSEWVSDGLVFPPPGGADPRGDPAALLKVVRGGSFVDGVDKLSATYRAGVAPVTAHVSIGFRCAMDVPDPAADAAAP